MSLPNMPPSPFDMLISIGTVASDHDTPSFENVRVKLKAGCDVRPGQLLKFTTTREGGGTLIGRVRSAYENNPNECADAINVRDTLQIEARYPPEADSTTIFRLVDVELLTEILGDETRAPQTLPTSGTPVYNAGDEDVVVALGLAESEPEALTIGYTTTGSRVLIRLKREAIQRHLFIRGTTGSGKSYAMGVVPEELVRQGLPVIFIDTQDEYSALAQSLGGSVVIPGKDFNIRISSLTDREVIDLIPAATELQQNIIAAAFLQLKDELRAGRLKKFVLRDLLDRIDQVGPKLTKK